MEFEKSRNQSFTNEIRVPLPKIHFTVNVSNCVFVFVSLLNNSLYTNILIRTEWIMNRNKLFQHLISEKICNYIPTS